MKSNSAEHILIVGPSWVGDMVMAQTLFMKLKQRNPAVCIDVLASDWSRPLLERMPEVNKAIAMPIQHGELALKIRRDIGKSLRSTPYTQAIILPNSFKSALIPWWANIPKRTGWRGEMRWGILNDIRHLNKARWPLMTERFMALALAPNEELTSPYPQPYLKLSAKNIAAARDRHGVTEGEHKILALCPGAEFGSAKRWPETHYAEVANYALNQGWHVWLFGSKNDMPVCETIQTLTQQRCVDLAGKTTLGEAIDLLAQVHAVITNDSGLMHISAALNKPIIAVYGSSDPRFTPPLADQVHIARLNLPCSPCFKRECPLTHLNCLTQLLPQQIIRALEAQEHV